MHLHYYRKHPNFGDSINPWYWGHYVPKALESDVDDLFVGIGTLLNNELPQRHRQIHIMGSGAGYGETIPRVSPNWHVHCVRGPLTAQAIGAAPESAVTDPAVLLSELIPTTSQRDTMAAFMPHIGIDSARLRHLTEVSGIRYISPASDPTTVINAVNRSDRLITSAMHGAILADALRVPWYCVSTSPEILRFKWQDWFLSVNLDAELHRLPTIWPHPGMGIKGWVVAQAKERLFCRELLRIRSKGVFLLTDPDILRAKRDQLKAVYAAFNECYSE